MTHRADQDAAGTDDYAPPPSARGGAPGKSTLTSRLWRSARRDDRGVAPGAEEAVAGLGGGGAPLPAGVRDRFEQSLGADLGAVRVHTDDAAATAADAVGARAFARGNDIHFAAGQYQPDDPFGMHLLAHEVAHTVQQSGGAATTQYKLAVSSPGDAAEVEADRAADAMVKGEAASVGTTAGDALGRMIFRDTKDATNDPSDDVDLKQLPKPPTYSAPDKSFAAMATALEAAMKGSAAPIAAPASGIAGSLNNLHELNRHARSEHTYYSNLPAWKSSSLTPTYAAVAKRDLEWGVNMLAEIGVASSATTSWVSLANASNSAWGDLVKHAKSMSIDVYNKVEPAGLAALGGNASPKLGDQVINSGEVAAAGTGLAVMAKKAGIGDGPDTSAYQDALSAFNDHRNGLTNIERRVVGQMNEAKKSAISRLKGAAEDEKAKWETIAKAVTVFGSGVTFAVGGGAAMVEGAWAAPTMGDPGAKHLTVGSKDGKGNIGIINNENDDFITTKPLDPVGISEKAQTVLSAGIQLKIDAINKQIATYETQLGVYNSVAEAQIAKSYLGDYLDALAKEKKLALNVEKQRALMEKKIVEWGKQIDAKLIEQGKLPKGTDDNAQAARLFAKLRAAATSTAGALEALGDVGSASLPKVYGDIVGICDAKVASEEGRSDPRSKVFTNEASRWKLANAAAVDAGAALARRQKAVAALETEFLGTFLQQAGGKAGESKLAPSE